MSDQTTQIIAQLGALANMPSVSAVAQAAVALIADLSQQVVDLQAKLDATPTPTPTPTLPAKPIPASTNVTVAPWRWPAKWASNTDYVVSSGNYTLSALDFSNIHDLTIKWDGTGSKPTLKFNGPGDNMVLFGPASRNITFDGFTIDAAGRNAFHLAGRTLTFRNLDFTSCANAFLAESSVSDVLIKQCNVTSETAMSGYFVWGGVDGGLVENVTIRKCRVPNSTREHAIRFRTGTIRNIVIEDCDLANISRQNVDPKDDNRSVIAIQQGSGYTIRRCTIRGSTLEIGVLGGDDGATAPDALTAHTGNVLVEDCTFVGASIAMQAGISDVTIRRCKIDIDFPDPAVGLGACIDIAGQDISHGWKRYVENVLIEADTATTNTRMARFLNIRGAVAGLKLRGNTFNAPNLITGGSGSIISSPRPQYIAESTGNVWPDAKTDGWANGGIFNLGPDGTGTGHGFWSKAMWMKLPFVKGDAFK